MSKLYPGIYSPFLHSYESIRDLYKSMHRTEDLTGRKLTAEDYAEIRRSARVVYRQPARDPLAKPMTDGWRHILDRDGIDAEGRDYRIIPEDPDHPMTDEQIAEYLYESEVYCGPSRYDFDCTGERLTWGWHYTRTPAGIAIIHEWYVNT